MKVTNQYNKTLFLDGIRICGGYKPIQLCFDAFEGNPVTQEFSINLFKLTQIGGCSNCNNANSNIIPRDTHHSEELRF